MNEIVNPLEPFKFWASKPLNIALVYLENYAKDKKILLDPFAGSGVFCYAALLKGMKAIYNDLCPYGLFLARNAIKPVDPKIIQKFYNEVLRRVLNVDIVTEEGKVIIHKGTPVEEAIKWFYETTCDCSTKNGKRVCNEEVVAEYYIWDTEYFIEKKIGDKYTAQKIKEKDKRYKIFFDTICDVKYIELPNEKKQKVYIFSRKKINEKWKEAFEKDPKEWIEHSRRGKREPGIVNEVAANLIRLGIAKRYKRFPILKKITCPIHGEQLQTLNEKDLKKIETIESLRYPFPNLIPEVELVYKHNEKVKPFLQYREFQTFVIENLSTIEKEDLKNKIPKLKHYFTKRNLMTLSLLFWSITQIKDRDIRDQIYLIFISNLHMNAKFDRLGNYGRWATGYYASLDDFKENNVLDQFAKSWIEIKKVKEAVWNTFHSNLNKFSYDETWDIKEFLNFLNEPKKKNILWLRQDAKNLGPLLGRCIVDVVFTDPPYRGGEFSVQYYELTTFYEGWLALDKEWRERYGDFEWWKNEVIENEMQEKDLNKYFELLRDSFVSFNNLVKQDAIWIITYHSPSKDVWEGVRKVLEEINLKVPTYEEVKTHQIRAKGKGSFYVTRHGSIGEDAYIVLTKEEKIIEETIKPSKKLAIPEFLELVFEKMKPEILKSNGIITWEMFARYFPDIVVRYGGPYGETKSYKELLENITIELAEGARILDRDKVGDKLYIKIYSKINPEKLIRGVLTFLGNKRGEIPRSELDLKILPKINGRIDDSLKVRFLKELFVFDPIGNRYIFKQQPKTLERFLPKLKEKELAEKPAFLPPEIVYKIKETARKYGGHVVKELRGDFSLSVIVRGFEYLIDITDEASIRRFAMGTSEKEKSNKIIVYVNYSTKDNVLNSLAKQLNPAIFVVVPYEKNNIVIDAFRDYEPLDGLKKFIVRGK